MRPFPARRCAASIAALAAFLFIATTPARALETRDLAGWWIAIDDTFPALWKTAGVVTMEELLIVAPDGGVQNRMMGFWIANADDCQKGYACSDAPLIAIARLALKGDVLSVTGRAEGSQVIDSPKRDPLIRRVAVTASPAWTASLSDGLLILRAVTTNMTRAFARIEPDRLRRLRAASLRMVENAVQNRAVEHFMVERFDNAQPSDAESAAYARVIAETKNRETTDVEVKKLFCLDG